MWGPYHKQLLSVQLMLITIHQSSSPTAASIEWSTSSTTWFARRAYPWPCHPTSTGHSGSPAVTRGNPGYRWSVPPGAAARVYPKAAAHGEPPTAIAKLVARSSKCAPRCWWNYPIIWQWFYMIRKIPKMWNWLSSYDNIGFSIGCSGENPMTS